MLYFERIVVLSRALAFAVFFFIKMVLLLKALMTPSVMMRLMCRSSFAQPTAQTGEQQISSRKSRIFLEQYLVVEAKIDAI